MIKIRRYEKNRLMNEDSLSIHIDCTKKYEFFTISSKIAKGPNGVRLRGKTILKTKKFDARATAPNSVRSTVSLSNQVDMTNKNRTIIRKTRICVDYICNGYSIVWFSIFNIDIVCSTRFNLGIPL